MCSTGEKQHNTERTVIVLGLRPQLGLAVMMLCSAASILHHQGNENGEMPADTLVKLFEDEGF